MGLLDLLPWRRKSATAHVGTQTRSGGAHPFQSFAQYVPNKVNVDLYSQMREAIPVLDVGIQNLRRLIGVPKVTIGPPGSRRQKEWESWQRSVKVGKTGRGWATFVSAFNDALIQNGYSAAEILPVRGKKDIYALIPIDGGIVTIKDTEDPTELVLAERRPMEPEPVPYPIPEWILYSAYEATPKNPYGRGLLTGLPFLTDILAKIFYATGRNWERFGDLKYSVDINLPDGINSTQAQEFIQMAEASWKATMEKNRQGKVQDFFATNVKVSVIGADAKQLEMEIPVRTILEQIVAKTGLPPFVFGFSWSARDTMTKSQSDILTSLIDDWREMIDSPIGQIVEWWCRFRGYPVQYEIEWPDASLQDIEGMANAELTQARAENQRLNNIMLARDLEEQGYIESDVVDEIVENQRGKGGRQSRTKAKRTEKANNDDTDPERLPQKVRDTRKIDRIGAAFERQTAAELKKVRQRLFRFMDSRVEKSAARKSVDIEDIRQVVEEEINAFVAATIGETAGYTSIYDVLIRAAALAGFESAVEDIQRAINEDAAVQSQFDFSTEYVRQLRTQGMDIVTTEAKNLKEACRDIMERHAVVGDNPERWATSLQSELSGQLDEKRWYWRRLGRSEAAMMFDRAAEEEYAVQEILFVKWIVAPDACSVCKQYANKIFPLRDSPRTVFDTHPHCRCRKMAVTIDTADEARQAGNLISFNRTNTPRKEVNNHGKNSRKKKHDHEGTCRCG
ncbi:hypothetical protein [Brevibacillus centrosporus]|uniref:hypothetical protein n=1 Tax=Brevibacillus centrosporus TaxID=54910 RepID=UPI002E1CBBDE|nr:hypothetical protein [Brevibacillus centrosporus]